MTRAFVFLCTIAALAVSACSQQTDVPAPANTETAFPTPDATIAPRASASPLPTTAVGIPDVLQGRWGLVEADCEEGRADAKGLMVVDADRLKFYESAAVLGKIADRTDSRIRAVFSFTGEGQAWRQDMLLETRGDGVLLRRDYGGEGLPEPLTYLRCP